MEDEDKKEERRKFQRYNTEVKIYFDFTYDLETKVEFELVEEAKTRKSSKKYSAVSRNISVEGLCFISKKRVKEGEKVNLDVYLPSSNDPIPMTGEVGWCAVSSSKEKKYNIGIKLLSVKDESVSDSVYYDKEYKVNWSAVMESVFGNYKLLMGGKYKPKSD